VVRVTRTDIPDRSVLVYVISQEDVEPDLAISRRAFMELGVLANETVPCRLEVVG
jgi:hypothetical protein